MSVAVETAPIALESRHAWFLYCCAIAGTVMVHFWSFPVCFAVFKQADIGSPLKS
ncbi:hypothetical protein CHELA20_20050 [Hyphomicrobiales bacterium]|nr:hypothetical protein CHELA41_10003 [Hyphomicrobiales bacterium]CAH1661230.1 hypothetical protein CHELA20_20050 [Hyphomicrobiales bacterium]CAH1696742.1 hypothetical protein CHELA1G2_50042 [Hyphomicrobiales bacterium]CAH1703043.1 hypothetical protein BOSEA1005_40031 [Hyphomicrobiales bacterium]CAI0347188.1 hypothetical protein BO1005MUT1_560003 [Hyphomicrobiales bacterium]